MTIIPGVAKIIKMPGREKLYNNQLKKLNSDVPVFSTVAEVGAFRDEHGLPEIKMRKDGSHPTQIATTKSTYRKTFDTIMPEKIRNGRILDFGAGKNIGGKEIGADTYEPFPEKGFNPTFSTSADIPSNCPKAFQGTACGDVSGFDRKIKGLAQPLNCPEILIIMNCCPKINLQKKSLHDS